jgi:glycosyltransferase involved in cell wall biosynthesis
MNQRTPLISVAMPVHNALPFLDESIASVLAQTLTDFELVILDDGSTDGLFETLTAWSRRDSRVRIFRNETRTGLSRSSNSVVSQCRASIIARMDGDDVSHPDRLLRQWNILEHEPSIVAVGTLCDGIDATGRMVRPRDRWRIVRRSCFIPFPHGSAMFRREAFDAIGGYREETDGGEDQDLFLRMTRQGKVVTLPDVLYRYRYHQQNSTLHNGHREIGNGHLRNANDLMAFYRLGAMRLWAGHPPMILEPLLARAPLGWNLASLVTLVSATWGSFSPPTLRLFLRSVLRTRDLIASLQVKDGTPYEWRLE